MSRRRQSSPDAAERAEEAISRATSARTEPDLEPLSDVRQDVAREIRSRWPSIARDDRLTIVQQMSHVASSDITRNFERVLAIAADDPDATIREVAVEGLWECTSDRLYGHLLDMAGNEESPRVRASLARTFSHFLSRTDLGASLAERRGETCNALLQMAANDPDYTVRNEALSGLGHCPSPQLDQLIRDGLTSGEFESISAALRAIGNSGAIRWQVELEDALKSDDEEIRAEAATAIKLSGDQRFIDSLTDIATEDEGEPQLAAIAALGEIGGPQAIRILQQLTDNEDEAVVEAADDAIDAATLLDDMGRAPHEASRDQEAE